MALKIRLARGGAKKKPFYSIVVADSRAPRDGRFIEKLGTYNPLLAKDSGERIRFSEERVRYWLERGARPTDRVARFLGSADILPMPERHNPQKAQPKAKAQAREAERREAAAAATASPEPAAEAPAAEEPAVETAGAEESAAEEAASDETAAAAAAETAQSEQVAAEGEAADEGEEKGS